MSEECNHDFVHGAWSGPKCLLCHMRKEDCDRIEQLEGRLHDADLQGAKLEAEREHYRHVWATEIDRANRAELTIKAIRDLPRYNRYQVMDDTADDNSSRWILADKLEALLPKE